MQPAGLGQTASLVGPRGLTTTRAAFIEEAIGRGELFIEQPNDEYSEGNHAAWRALFARMQQDRWPQYANPAFLQGIDSLCFDCNQVPRLDDVNKFLEPLTGFKAKAVAGYVPAYRFFDCLRQKEFPTTITIRDENTLDYLPEPDIFHDIAGHVPMHTNQDFADTLVRFGKCAQAAAIRVKEMSDEEERIRCMTSIFQAMARFFWFTIEFGLMQRPGKAGLCVYGSGLLSSYGEIKHCIESPTVQRPRAQLEWMINQSFKIDRYQPLLFVVNSFEHLYQLIGDLEKAMFNGKLDNVALGDPDVSSVDLNSFLEVA